MAFVQIGKRKINTSMICFAEEEAGTVRIWFTGQPTVLEFEAAEAIALWKAIKAEAVLGAPDSGFKMQPKKETTPAYDMGHEKALVLEKPVLNAPKPATSAPPLRR